MTKTVLVTGADGFIGSHLVELLLKENYHVVALVQYNAFNHWGWLEEIKPNDMLEVKLGDIRDAKFCRSLMRRVNAVCHLAALIAIPYSYHAPQSYIDTNVQGTLNLCQAALDEGVEHFIHTSTSEVYGTAQYVPIDERHPLSAQSPYSASKIGAEAIAYSYFASFSLPLTIARPFNTYGPRQSARAVIPTIISQVASGQEAVKLGDTRPTRNFNFVKDTCAGFLAMLKHSNTLGKTLNIGSANDIAIGELVRLIGELMDREISVTTDSERFRPENSEVMRLSCDGTALQALTQYSPVTSLRTGLEETIRWFMEPENAKRYKAEIYNR